jgi:aconitate hydratase
VKAVVAESFERIHRSNLIGMGVLPLVFKDGATRKTLGLKGDEVIDIRLPAGVKEVRPAQDMELVIARADGRKDVVTVKSRLNTDNEIEYFRSGGILQYVLNNLVESAK